MNEELISELSEAMKRREKAQAAVARWQEQLNDANEDIQELSARIAEHAPTYGDPEPEVEAETFVQTIHTHQESLNRYRSSEHGV
jgi:phage shock protein A